MFYFKLNPSKDGIHITTSNIDKQIFNYDLGTEIWGQNKALH